MAGDLNPGYVFPGDGTIVYAADLNKLLADATIKPNAVSMDKLAADVRTTIQNMQQAVIDAIYDLGAIYLSESDEDPSETLGGEWEKIEGALIIGADEDHPAGTSESVGFGITLIKCQSTSYGWYKLYSNGWCEQGGIITPETFPREFIDTAYTILVTPPPNRYNHGFDPRTKRTTGVDVYIWGTTVNTSGSKLVTGTALNWFACGYAELTEEEEALIPSISVRYENLWKRITDDE